MFGLFNKKPRTQIFKAFHFDASSTPEFESISGYHPLIKRDGFTRLNREQIQSIHKILDESKFNQYYLECLVPCWLLGIKDDLHDKYQLYTSNNFYLLTSEDEKFISSFLTSLENIRKRIIRGLGKLHQETDEKLPVIIIDDIEKYYEYISYYYPEEGTFSESGGVFLRELIPHFVFPQVNKDSTISVAAHELTHALLSHQELPLWLDEGMAVNMEATITNFNPFRLTQEKHHKHLTFWDRDTIQEFWSGQSFSRPDEGNELSYQLAQLITRSLAENHDAFYAFVNDANYQDAGEASLRKHYDLSLGDIIENVFGEGDWQPSPQKWQLKNES